LAERVLLKIACVACRILGLVVVLFHRDQATAAEMLVLRHENAVLRRQQHEAHRLPGEIRDRTGTIGRSGPPCISRRHVGEPRRVQRSEPVNGQNIPLHPLAVRAGSQ